MLIGLPEAIAGLIAVLLKLVSDLRCGLAPRYRLASAGWFMASTRSLTFHTIKACRLLGGALLCPE